MPECVFGKDVLERLEGCGFERSFVDRRCPIRNRDRPSGRLWNNAFVLLYHIVGRRPNVFLQGEETNHFHSF